MIRVVLATKTTPNRRICCLVIMVPIITGCDGLTVDPIKLKIKVTNEVETWVEKPAQIRSGFTIHTFNFHFHDKLKVKYHVKEPSKLFIMILKLCLKHDHWQSYGSSNFNHCTKRTFSVTFLPISRDPI